MKPLLDLKRIIQMPLPEDQYYKAESVKRQIILHHTASGKGVDGDFSHWLGNPDRIATCIIVDYDGFIYQLFGSQYWGHHLGVSMTSNKLPKALLKYKSGENNVLLNRQAIAIEIDSWGPLRLKGGKYYAWPENFTKVVVPANEVVELPVPFRGEKYFQKYSDPQIESVRQLLVYWNGRYNIPLTYNQDIWDVNEPALSGQPGVFTHVSFRTDKTDCYPEDRLITMLKDPF